MSYPERLLPQINYNIIDVDKLPENSYLLRYTDSQDIWDTLDKLKVDIALPNKKDFFGLSCNLYGVFLFDDIFLKVTSAKLLKDWAEGMSPLKVNASDFILTPERSGFFLKLNDLHKKKFPFERTINNTKSPFESIATVHHKPIFCNFWHFELHFKDNDGVFIDRNKSNKWVKKFADSLRKSILKKFAYKEVKDSETLLESLYVTNIEKLKENEEEKK